MTTAAKRARKKANKAAKVKVESQSEAVTERSPFEQAAAMAALAKVREMKRKMQKND